MGGGMHGGMGGIGVVLQQLRRGRRGILPEEVCDGGVPVQLSMTQRCPAIGVLRFSGRARTEQGVRDAPMPIHTRTHERREPSVGRPVHMGAACDQPGDDRMLAVERCHPQCVTTEHAVVADRPRCQVCATVEQQVDHRQLPLLAGDVQHREVVARLSGVDIPSAAEPLLDRGEGAVGDSASDHGLRRVQVVRRGAVAPAVCTACRYCSSAQQR